MASYRIEIKASASKELNKLSQQMIPEIVAAIEKLAEDPYPQGVKKLKGFDQIYRIRVGEYRVVYNILKSRLIIEIIRVRHRKDAYR
jgi:mRNA interferase RelE/StbE